MSNMKSSILVLRWIMEAGIVLALAYWGARTGGSTIAKILLAIGAPVVGFGFWGLVDFRWAGRPAEAMRLVQELVVSAAAALALYAAGARALGWALAGVSVLYHVLVYATGGRLLERRER
jgi:hypothetical protein